MVRERGSLMRKVPRNIIWSWAPFLKPRSKKGQFIKYHLDASWRIAWGHPGLLEIQWEPGREMRALWRSESGMEGSREMSCTQLHAHGSSGHKDQCHTPAFKYLHSLLPLEVPLHRSYQLKCCPFFKAHGNAGIEGICAQDSHFQVRNLYLGVWCLVWQDKPYISSVLCSVPFVPRPTHLPPINYLSALIR